MVEYLACSKSIYQCLAQISLRNWKNNANKELPGEKWESGNKITSFWHQQPFAIAVAPSFEKKLSEKPWDT